MSTTVTPVKASASTDVEARKSITAAAESLSRSLGRDESESFKRADVAYTAIVDKGLSVRKLASALSIRIAARANPSADASDLAMLATAPEYAVSPATVQRWAQSFGIPVRHGIPVTPAVVAATARVLNNTPDPVTKLDNAAALAVVQPNPDAVVSTYLEGIRSIIVESAAARDAAKAARAAVAASKSGNGNSDDGSGDAGEGNAPVTVSDGADDARTTATLDQLLAALAELTAGIVSGRFPVEGAVDDAYLAFRTAVNSVGEYADAQ